MHSLFKPVLALGLLLGIDRALFAETGGRSGGPNPRITVRTYDYARLPPARLARAQVAATHIFRTVGVEPLWLNCPLPQEDPGANPACQQRHGPTHLLVKILPRSMERALGAAQGVLGLAVLPTGSGRGSHLYILYDRVQELASRIREVDRSVILGHVVAHEIGHLLLGSNSHSPGGIMAADWFNGHLRKLAQGGLLFTPPQPERIRGDVRARMEEEALSSSLPGFSAAPGPPPAAAPPSRPRSSWAGR